MSRSRICAELPRGRSLPLARVLFPLPPFSSIHELSAAKRGRKALCVSRPNRAGAGHLGQALEYLRSRRRMGHSPIIGVVLIGQRELIVLLYEVLKIEITFALGLDPVAFLNAVQ
jgi:hypothetical protein